MPENFLKRPHTQPAPIRATASTISDAMAPNTIVNPALSNGPTRAAVSAVEEDEGKAKGYILKAIQTAADKLNARSA